MKNRALSGYTLSLFLACVGFGVHTNILRNNAQYETPAMTYLIEGALSGVLFFIIMIAVVNIVVNTLRKDIEAERVFLNKTEVKK